MLDAIAAFWFGMIGACIGSFVNVVAYRMPRGMSVVWKPSHCPKCGRDIRMRDNIPVLGWLFLRGRCRDCGAPIAARYAIVEALLGVAFAWLAYAELLTGAANLPGGPLVPEAGVANLVLTPHSPLLWLFAFHAVLLSVLMALALIDQDGQRVPWKIVIFALAIAAVGAWTSPTFFPERGRTTRVAELKAPLDALAGVAWGALPWIAALAVAKKQGHSRYGTRLGNIAAALGVIGAFLGLRPVVRISLVWVAVAAVLRAVRREGKLPIGVVAALWPLVLLHLVLWRHVSPLLNW